MRHVYSLIGESTGEASPWGNSLAHFDLGHVTCSENKNDKFCEGQVDNFRNYTRSNPPIFLLF